MTVTTRGDSGFLNKIMSENDEIYTLLTSFLVFNLFAAIGSIVASKIHWVNWNSEITLLEYHTNLQPTPRYLKFAIILRALFIPFFFFCNYRVQTRAYPVFFESTDIFVIGGIAMSFSHGYLSALAMGYTPKWVTIRLLLWNWKSLNF